MKFKNSNNSRNKRVELNILSQREYSIKEEKSDNNLKPRLYLGGDFMHLVTGSTIFVDKTMFIKEIIEDSSHALLITMPRRWGKSLNLDMLRRFFSIQTKNGQIIKNDTTENYKLFIGDVMLEKESGQLQRKIISPCKLVINHPEYLKKQGQYPVIFIDFKDCKADDLENAKLKLKKKIIQTINSFKYLARSEGRIDQDNIGKKYSELLSNADTGDFDDAILKLSCLLYHHHDKKVWILIDEYDAAANLAYLEFPEDEAKKVANLYRRILEPAFKGNPSLEKGVITGVLPVLINDMSSGLNNVSKHDVTSFTYSKYYGIDQEEMNQLLEHFKIKEQEASQIQNWYNGYISNHGTQKNPKFVSKYNIWSVVNYLTFREGLKSYWGNSSLGSLIHAKLLKNSKIKNNLESLILNKNLIIENITTNFGIKEFSTLKAIIEMHDIIKIDDDGVIVFFSYLFFNGYLTKTSTRNNYAIPNNEIRVVLENKLKSYYNQIFNYSTEELNSLTAELNSIFSKKDSVEISDIFTKKFGPDLEAFIKNMKVYRKNKKSVISKGALGNEDLMHTLFNMIALQVKAANFGTEVYSERTDGSKGIIDPTLSKNGISLIIEMKYTKVGKNQEIYNKILNQAALDQAKSYKNYIKESKIKIFLVCNITGNKTVFLSGEIIKGGDCVKFEYPISH